MAGPNYLSMRISDIQRASSSSSSLSSSNINHLRPETLNPKADYPDQTCIDNAPVGPPPPPPPRPSSSSSTTQRQQLLEASVPKEDVAGDSANSSSSEDETYRAKLWDKKEKLHRHSIPGQIRVRGYDSSTVNNNDSNDTEDDDDFYDFISRRPHNDGKLKSRPVSTALPGRPVLLKAKSYHNNFGISDENARNLFKISLSSSFLDDDDRDLELDLKKPLSSVSTYSFASRGFPFRFMASTSDRDWLSQTKEYVKSSGRKMLPPQSPQNEGKITLVLDMDETLVHAKIDKVRI